MENQHGQPISNIFHPGTISKSELQEILGVKRSYFYEQLLILEPDLLKYSPNYKRNSKLLRPNEAKFIAYHLGYDDNELIEKQKQWKEKTRKPHIID